MSYVHVSPPDDGRFGSRKSGANIPAFILSLIPIGILILFLVVLYLVTVAA